MRARLTLPFPLLYAVVIVSPAAAQDRQEESLGVYRAEPPEEIDILADVPEETRASPAQIEACRRDQEAAIISDEIVVCGKVADQSQYRTMSREDAQRRYAEETNKQGAFGAPDFAPDVAGPGIFRGKPTVSGLCLPLSCPPALPEFIDVSALPQAPPGSDADRIARGLPPIGNDTGVPPAEQSSENEQEIGEAGLEPEPGEQSVGE